MAGLRYAEVTESKIIKKKPETMYLTRMHTLIIVYGV